MRPILTDFWVIEWNWHSIPGYICRTVMPGKKWVATCDIWEAAHFRTQRDAEAWMQELDLPTSKWRIAQHGTA